MIVGIVERVGPLTAELRIRRPFFLTPRDALPREIEPGDEVELKIWPGEKVANGRTVCLECGADIPDDGDCWYCENEPLVAGEEAEED